MLGHSQLKLRAAAVMIAVSMLAAAAALPAGANDTGGNASALPDRAAPHSQARQRVLQAAAELEAYLERGNDENAAAWRRWLEWDRMLASVNGDPANVEEVWRFEARLRRNVRGLEQEPFLRLRKELKRFAAHAELAASSQPDLLYVARRRAAAERAAELGANPTHADALACARLLEWLAFVGGSDGAWPKEIRGRYATPNATARASRRFMDFVAQRAIEDSQEFTAWSQGAMSFGTAITSATVGVRLAPNAAAAAVDLQIDGRVSMPNTVSTRRRVAVYSSADVAIRARKRVTLNAQGVHSDAASASTTAGLRIDSVSAPLRFVEQLAWRRANRLRSDAEADTSRRVADEIESRADELSSEFIANAHRVFCDEIRSPLVRLDAMPERLEFSTTADHLHLTVLQRNSAQLGASQAARPFTTRDDVAARIHESFVNNLASSLLADQSVRDRQWLEMMKLLTGRQPRALWVHDRSTPWSVTFAEHLPLTTRMVDGRIAIELRFAAVRWDDETWTTPIRVEARFEPRVTRDGPALIRDGELGVIVEAPESSLNERSPDELRRMLARRFEAILPPELYFDGLVPPSGGALSKLRALVLRDFYCDEGWLVIGYELDVDTNMPKVPDKLLTRNE